MFVHNKVKGIFMLELLIGISIIVIIIPVITNSTKIMYRTIITEIEKLQLEVEQIEQYYRLYEDSQNIYTEYYNDCCFVTDYHNICYDIVNNRIRRRKKKFESMAFYTHYIGGHKKTEQINCEIEGKRLKIGIELTNKSSLDYIFFITTQESNHDE